LQDKIYYITSELLENSDYFDEVILSNTQNSYYWSDDCSEEFYISLAKAGFISTTYDAKDGLVLLPELQYDYAILDFKDLYISKKVQKLLDSDKYIFSQNTQFENVLEQIDKLHKYNWLKGEYKELLKSLYASNDDRDDFEVMSFELTCSQTNELVAGEVGYKTGDIYTSLSGFSSREKQYNNFGNLQLVLLSQHLEKQNYSFWNLGHPHMEYKKKLGAKVYSREEFLRRFKNKI